MSAEAQGRAPVLAGAGMEVAASALVLGYGVLLDRVLPDLSHVPANLAAAALAVFLAGRAGVGMDDMGLAKDRLTSGLELGLYSMVPIAAAIALGAAIPWTREFFLDTDVTGASTGRAVYELLIRIPIGTALAEEVIFRGALMGLFLKRRTPVVAAALSSVVFGLWHISPTIKSLATNQAAGNAASSTLAATGIVAGIVAVTAVAGGAFAWLRLKSGSLAAPWIAHTSVNSFAYIAGRIAGRCK